MTEELASRLLGLGRASSWPPEMNVFRWELIQRGDTGISEPGALMCDPQVRDWLLGKTTLDETLVDAAKLIEPSTRNLPEWPVDEIGAWIDKSLQQPDTPRLRVIVVAPRGGGKRTFAAAVMPGRWACRFSLSMRTHRMMRAGRGSSARTTSGVSGRDGTGVDGRGWRYAPWPANSGFVSYSVCFMRTRGGASPITGAMIVRSTCRCPKPARASNYGDSPRLTPRKWPDDELRRLAEHHSVWPGDIELAPAALVRALLATLRIWCARRHDRDSAIWPRFSNAVYVRRSCSARRSETTPRSYCV